MANAIFDFYFTMHITIKKYVEKNFNREGPLYDIATYTCVLWSD